MRGRTHPGVARRMMDLIPHTTEVKIIPKFLLRWLIELSTISNGSTPRPGFPGWFEPESPPRSLVQPDTLLRWHRELFHLYWKHKSKTRTHQPKIAAETIALIRQMAKDNRLWGAERIRGELLKLGLRVCKRTVQKYMRSVRTKPPRGQKWSTFLHNHAANIWACDFLQVTDLFFRPLAGLLPHRAQDTTSDPCRSHTITN